MGFSKKTGKGRLDKYYFLAKDQGYRARSAFKLVQLHKKYNLLDQARVVIDLCAAPGGWLQVAAKYTPVSHVIVGVDLVPIKPIPGVKTIVADITTEKCRSELKKELKNWKADAVLHDGAPNVGKSWLHDAYSQSELVLHSLKLATEFLAADGCFVTKVFRSKDYNALMWVFNQLFKKVEATKPASSRTVSAEIFVVCRGFKAPNHIDPRLLDPKHVFEDITLLQGGVAKVDLLHPEKKIRHREGYEDGATMLFKTTSVEDFITSNEPNTILATFNQIQFTKETPKKVCDLADELAEIRVLCADLKVLGRREFKILSRWRKEARQALGIITAVATDSSKGEMSENVVVEENPICELDELAKKQDKQVKRDKRKALERKAKQRMRMQLSMGNADDLADEYAENEPLFSLVKSSGIVGNEDIVLSESDSDKEGHCINESEIETLSEDDDEALWESDLEADYERRQQKELSKNAVELVRSRRKKAVEHDEELDNQMASGSENEVVSNSDNEIAENPRTKLTTSLLKKEEEKANQDAKMALWYSNPLFRELDENPMPGELEESSKKKLKQEKKRKAHELEQMKQEKQREDAKKSKKLEPGEIVFVKAESSEDEEEELMIDPKTKESVLTPHGMTLAAKIARDQKRAKKDLIDESFNRYSFKDDGILPRWFLDDESKHNRPQKPITKEGVALLKAKMKELDSRPIKKELEAKGRNRQRVVRKLEAMKKKAAVIADSEDMGERQKSEQIQKMLSKAGKPQRKETKLVVARGSKRGVKGRPKGVKGHYKMVDSRMKKEVRAQKRIKARGKKNGGRR
ncbi:AdoMet-dependent rRNA methyltransferase SPB1 [Paramicrosporidium saccamoebae]|uniref:AdoMet-dependent rRNA methyltransferase SPB1 n=1 Tax=Paramicrosporidium saccamoebae TaxID=1246581 RepID=A0A2H9TQZ4_9FUNG|nr:AdoMet-dependent rRNA methyltransferase SPB1 [Paramicrosporidium saccamoebae]